MKKTELSPESLRALLGTPQEPWLIANFPKFVATIAPELVAITHPKLVIETHPEWMLRNHPELIQRDDDDVPLDVLTIVAEKVPANKKGKT